MKRLLLTGTLAIFTCCTLIGFAQDNSKPAATKTTPAVKKGRLPANFGKLGLNDPQKDKIYAIQGSYADQLDALEAQVAAVKAKRDHEVEGVLTEDQRKVLKNLTDAAKDAKDKGKKDDAAKNSDDEKKEK